MKQKYVDPQLLKEELNRHKTISEYKYFTDLSEEDDNKVDQLTMDDFQSAKGPQGGAPEAGGPPPEGGGAPPAPDAQPPQGGAPDAGAADAGAPPEDPFAGGDAGAAPDAAAPDAAGGEPTQEVDVTDIVNDTKAISQKTDEVSGKTDKTLEMVNALMAKITGLEGNVSKMDQALAKIDTIYKEFQLSKPPSPEEVKQAMAQNSYPFNVPLSDYGKEGVDKNQTEMEMKKNKLSLSNLLSDFNERDVRNSFNPPDPTQDRISRALPSYRL